MEEALPECHHQESVRFHRGDADPMKGARNSGLHLSCCRLCLDTGSKASRSFLGPAPGAAGLCPTYVPATGSPAQPLQPGRPHTVESSLSATGSPWLVLPRRGGICEETGGPGAGTAVSWGLTAEESRADGSESLDRRPGVPFSRPGSYTGV